MGHVVSRMNHNAQMRVKRREYKNHVQRVRSRAPATWHGQPQPIRVEPEVVLDDRNRSGVAPKYSTMPTPMKRPRKPVTAKGLQSNKPQTKHGLRLTEQWVVSECGKNLGQISQPSDVALLSGGYVAVVEEKNRRVQIFNKRGKSIRFINQMHHNEVRWPTCVCENKHNSTLLVGDSDMVHIFQRDGTRSGYCTFDAHMIRHMCLMTRDQHLAISDEGSEAASPAVSLFTLEGRLVREMVNEFQRPHYLASDNELHLMAVSDSYANTVTLFDTRTSHPTHILTHGAADAEFCSPGGVAFLPASLLVADRGRNVIHEMDMRSKKWKACLSEVDGIRAPLCVATDTHGRVAMSEEWMDELDFYTVKLFALGSTPKVHTIIEERTSNVEYY